MAIGTGAAMLGSAVIGAGASMAGGRSQSGGTQTTTVEPPAYLRPFIQGAIGAASNRFNSGGPQLWNQPGVAGPSDTTQQALALQQQRAMAGSPLVGQAQQFVQQGLNSTPSTQFGGQNPFASSVGGGQMFQTPTDNPFGGTSNPFLEQTFNRAFGNAMQGVESQFARGGRNLNAAQPVAADLASNLASQIYAPAFENERNRQLQFQSQLTGIGANAFEAAQGRDLQARLNAQQIGAQGFESGQNRALTDLTAQRGLQQNLLSFASPLAAMDYQDIAQLRDAGATRDTFAQAQLSDQVQRFNQQALQPEQNLDAFINRIGAMPGSQTTQQLPPQFTNPAAGALGGAMMGAQLGSMFTRPQTPVLSTPPFVPAPNPQAPLWNSGFMANGGTWGSGGLLGGGW